MKTIYKIYLAILLLPAYNLVHAQGKAAIIDTLMQRTHRLGLFNGNILVIDHGKKIYQNAIGQADTTGKIKLTSEYRFHIGSIAKEFNAVGIMMLKEQGKLSLDDKVSKYLPQLPAWANTVSIKNLLQYTSGVPDVKWKTVKSDADNMDDLMKVQQLDFEPETKYAYNNNNVFLQRRIIEKITGLSFKRFVEEKLLKPAGMTTAIVDPNENTPLMAVSYNNSNRPGSFFYPITGWTAVTLADFNKWEQALEQFKLISPASTQVLLTPFAPGKQCGLGGGSMQNNKLIHHQHDGISINYQALVVADPLKGRTVILMSNNRQNNVYDINNALQDILDGKTYVQPKRPIISDYQKQLATMTGEQVIALLKDLNVKYPEKYDVSSEKGINEVGYALMNNKRVDAAIELFKYNVELHPNSGNAYDSLGEAYYNKGDKANALNNYKRSLQLDPTNVTAKTIIAELEK